MGLATDIDAELTKACVSLAKIVKGQVPANEKTKTLLTNLNVLAGTFKKVNNSSYKKVKETTDKLVKELTQLLKEVTAMETELLSLRKEIAADSALESIDKDMGPIVLKMNRLLNEKVKKVLETIKKEKQKVST
jgi:hypothetical protein